MGQRVHITTAVPTLGHILKRFWPLMRRQRWLIALSSLALFAEVGLRLLEPWPLKFVLDDVLTPAKDASPAGGLAPMTILMLAAIGVIVVAALKAIGSYLRRVGFALAGSRVLAACRSDLFTHIQRLSLSYHSRKRTGDMLTRVIGDIGQLKEVVITAVMPLAAHFLTLLAMVVVMFWMDWRLALVALAIVPLFALTSRRYGRRIRQVARKQRQRKGEMGATAAEALGAIRIVQALSLESVHEKHFAARNKSDLREGVRAKRLTARLIGTTDVLIALATAVVLYFGSRLVLRDALTIGELWIFLAYLKNAFRPIRNMAKYSGRVAKAVASAERIVEVLDTTPAISNRPDAADAPEVIESVRFEDVVFAYEPGHPVLHGVSLEARRGQVVIFAGPSGAGKTTLINLLLRLYDPDEGRVLIDGRDARELTYETLRRRIAVVPQENVLFAVSARDNIAYGALGATDEQVIAAAKTARAHKFIQSLPQGYDTVLGERGETLSEGQRQRLAIARAAIRRSPLLILDEPTASLDNQNNRSIRMALRELAEDRITFIIAHDLSTVYDDNLVVFLDGGRVVEQGTHAQLLRAGGAYAVMYALQQRDAEPEPTHAVPG